MINDKSMADLNNQVKTIDNKYFGDPNNMNEEELRKTRWERVTDLPRPRPLCSRIRDIERFNCDWKLTRSEK
nr:hypothetical transcript [Hymenolepis microstoma]